MEHRQEPDATTNYCYFCLFLSKITIKNNIKFFFLLKKDFAKTVERRKEKIQKEFVAKPPVATRLVER